MIVNSKSGCQWLSRVPLRAVLSLVLLVIVAYRFGDLRGRGEDKSFIIDEKKNIVQKGFHHPWKINPSNLLTFKESYFLEADVLDRLTELSRKAVPSASCSDQPHTPILLSRDDSKLTFRQSYEGMPITLASAEKGFCELSEEEVKRQAECLYQEMAAASVASVDVYPKNLVWNPENNKLVLIDFDFAVLDNNPKNGRIAERFRLHQHMDVKITIEAYYRSCCTVGIEQGIERGDPNQTRCFPPPDKQIREAPSVFNGEKCKHCGKRHGHERGIIER